MSHNPIPDVIDEHWVDRIVEMTDQDILDHGWPDRETFISWLTDHWNATRPPVRSAPIAHTEFRKPIYFADGTTGGATIRTIRDRTPTLQLVPGHEIDSVWEYPHQSTMVLGGPATTQPVVGHAEWVAARRAWPS